jgi:hypothetical protein
MKYSRQRIFEHFSHQLIRCGDGWFNVDKQETIQDFTAELDLASRIIGFSLLNLNGSPVLPIGTVVSPSAPRWAIRRWEAQ